MWGGLALVLVSPLVAMQFTPEINWGLVDFLAAALILGGGGVAAELAMRFGRSGAARVGVISSAVIVGALIWAQLAVRII